MSEGKTTGALPRVLLIESREDCLSSDPGFHEILEELSAGSFEVDPHTWTDGLMKTFPPLYRMVLMDCGRLGEYEFDVIRKVHAELGVPILLHSTEDRSPVVNEARREGVSEFLRKPFGMGNLVGKIVEILDPGAPTEPAGEGE